MMTEQIQSSKRQFSEIVGTIQLNKAPQTAILYLAKYIRKYWPSEAASFLMRAYSTALPLIQDSNDKYYNDAFLADKKFDDPMIETHRQMRLARAIIAEASNNIFGLMTNGGDEVLAMFFATQICQSPNPENAHAIEEMISYYASDKDEIIKKIALFKKVTLGYFKTIPDPKKEYDFGYSLFTAEGNHDTYFNSGQVYPKLLAFLYRRAGRVDAREALISSMLNGISQGSTVAMDVYLKELVEEDEDAPAILRLKHILLGKVQNISPQAKAIVLNGILSLDKAYKLYKPFLDGKETIDIEKGGVIKKKRFDIEFFAITELEPFYIARNASSDLAATNTEKEDWQTYVELISNMMGRKMFGAVKAHLNAFYSDLRGEHPAWRPLEYPANYSPLRDILERASKYAPMQEFLLHHVRTGNPFIGYYTLQISVTKMNTENTAFLNALKKLGLDAIDNHLRVLIDEKSPNGAYISPVAVDGTLFIWDYVMLKGYEDATNFMIRGLENSDDRVKHIYVHYAALFMNTHYNIYQIPDSIEGQKIRDELDYLRIYLSTLDLSYLSRITDKLISRQNPKTDVNVATSFGTSITNILNGFYRKFSNANVIPTLEGIFDIVSKDMPACDSKDESVAIYLCGNLELVLDYILSQLDVAYLDQKNKEAAVQGAQRILSLCERVSVNDSYVSDMLISKIGKVATYPELRGDAIETLKTIAERKGYGTMSALATLIKLYKKGDKSDSEIETYLKNFDPRGVIDKPDCHPTAMDTWREVLVEMIKMDNMNAYIAWRDFLVQTYYELATAAETANALKDINIRLLNELQNDLLTLVRLAATGEGPKWLARQLAKDVTDLYNDNPEIVEWAIGIVTRLADIDPIMRSLIKVSGKITTGLAFSFFAEEAKEHDEAYMILAMLARTNIPIFSEKARLALQSMARKGGVRDQVYNSLGFQEETQSNNEEFNF